MSKQPEQTPEERAILDLLQPLANVPQRDPRQATRGRAQFLSHVSSLESPVSSGPISRLKDWMLRQERYQLRFRTLKIGLVLAAIFLSSAGATAYASRQALPGDPLYGLKLFLEEAQLALTGDQTHHLDLDLQFANNRVGELQTILSQPCAEEPDELAENFHRHTNAAELLISEVENPDDYRDQLTQILDAYQELHPAGDDQTPQEPGECDQSSAPQEETPEIEAEAQEGESHEEEDSSDDEESDEDDQQAEEQEDNQTEDSDNDNEMEEETQEPDATHESDEEND